MYRYALNSDKQYKFIYALPGHLHLEVILNYLLIPKHSKQFLQTVQTKNCCIPKILFQVQSEIKVCEQR